MGLINKVDMVCLSACGIWCLADVLSVSPSSEQTLSVLSLFCLFSDTLSSMMFSYAVACFTAA